MFEYYTATIIVSVFAMIILIVNTTRSNTLTKEQKFLFRILFSIIAVAACCEWSGVLLDGTEGSLRLLHILIKTLELSISPCIAVVFAMIIKRVHTKMVMIVLVCHAVLEILSGIFGFIFYVDAGNYYYHGSFYAIYVCAYLLSLVYALCIVLVNMKHYQYSGAVQFFLIALLILTGAGIQLFNTSIRVTFGTLGVAASILYIVTLEMIQQTDGLTGLLNRRGFENCVAAEHDACVILFMDVDLFKKINDENGHEVGDKILKIIGRQLRRIYAPYGKCFRYGGDEFAVILRKKRDQVKQLNESFEEELAKEREEEKRVPDVSIGYASFDPKKHILLDIIKEADENMYHVKQAKKAKRKGGEA